MKILIYLSLVILALPSCFGQKTTSNSHPIANDKFKKVIDSYLGDDIQTTNVDILKELEVPYHLFDAREFEEYQVSHIPNAKYIGYKKPDYSILNNVEEDDIIIVYCSIGYRSEKISEQLLKRGYKNVLNLYGSIFEWANRGFMLHDIDNNPTTKIHGYNKKWSRWIENPSMDITY